MKKRSPCAKPAARARWWWTFPVVVCALLVVHPTQASDESHANRLFVEATKLIQAAEEEAVATRKLDLLKDAKRKLDTIVDRHPSSRLAVELVSGQNIGTVSLPGLVDAIEDAVVHVCSQTPTPACLLSLAVTAAEKIEDAYSRSSTLADIAKAQAAAGGIEEALATIETLEDADPVGALVSIAAAQAKNGNTKKAEEILATALTITGKIEGTYSRAWALAAVARAQAENGDIGKAEETLAIALATAEESESEMFRHDELVGIAEVQVRAGRIKEALAVAEKIEHDIFRSRPLAEIAAAQARAGNFEKALATTEEIEGAADRIQALVAIAEARARNGDARKAAEILAIALGATEKIENAERRTRTLADIAEAQAKAGDIEGAFATATSIRDAEVRAKAFVQIAAAAAETD